MELVKVGHGEIGQVAGAGSVLEAHGVCAGVVVIGYDIDAGVAGMAHCVLPRSPKELPEGAVPQMYANKGMLIMLEQLAEAGARRPSLQIKIVGGSHVLDCPDALNTGKAIVDIIEKLVEHNRLNLAGADTGGTIPRMVRYEVGGDVVVQSCGKEWTV